MSRPAVSTTHVGALLAEPRMVASGYRRWRALVLAAIMLTLICAALLARDRTTFGSRPLQSVLAMLDLRSPGARVAANLVDSKRRLATDAPATRALGKTFVPPQERALGKVFPSQVVVGPGTDVPFTPPFQPDVLDSANIPGAALAGPIAAPGGGGGGGGAGGGGPGGGGGAGGGAGGGGPGGGGGAGPIGEGPPPGPPVAAIPEPGTWLLMIVAFGFCGVMLRRQRRVRRGQVSCNPAS